MKILVVDRSPPCNLLQGNALIGQHLFRRLRHHQLTLVCPAPAEDIPRFQDELAELFDVVHLVPRKQPVSALVGMLEPSLAQLGLPACGRCLPNSTSMSSIPASCLWPRLSARCSTPPSCLS